MSVNHFVPPCSRADRADKQKTVDGRPAKTAQRSQNHLLCVRDDKNRNKNQQRSSPCVLHHQSDRQRAEQQQTKQWRPIGSGHVSTGTAVAGDTSCRRSGRCTGSQPAAVCGKPINRSATDALGRLSCHRRHHCRRQRSERIGKVWRLSNGVSCVIPLPVYHLASCLRGAAWLPMDVMG